MSGVTMKQVAKVAGVSVATVSRSINYPEQVREATRLKVERVIADTRYTPNSLARSFRRGRTHIVMVVLPSVGDPFFSDVMLGIRTASRERGYAAIIGETQFNTMTEDEIGAMLVSRQADGIILLACMSPFGTKVLSSKSREALPIVIGCETIAPELVGFPSVHVDNVAAAAEAVDYLILRGHRRIACIYGRRDTLLTKDREFGYREVMKRADLPIEKGWVVEGRLTLEGAIRATRELLNHRHRPSAIFCANDEMAAGCYHAVKTAGLRIPDDISVMGFDDVRYAAVMDPPLTTIRQPAEEIGRRVMYRLCREIEDGRGPGSRATEIVPHKLIIRQSVSGPPAA